MRAHRICRQRISLVLALGAAIAAAAIASAQGTTLPFAKASEDIAANIVAARGIAAHETVEHTRYEQRKKNATCAEMGAAGFEASRGPLYWQDRLRVDVTAAEGFQAYTFTNPGRFEKGDAGALLKAAGSGEFSMFLRNIIATDGENFQSHGLQQTPLGNLVEFAFTVPLAKSHFDYGPGPAGYHGALFVTPDTGSLKRLTMLMENQGDACSLQYTIDYAPTKAGGREIVLPQTSVMDVLYTDGKELHTETHYSGYYWPQLELGSQDTAAASKPLPAGLHLKVRLQDPIDGATAAAGDPVTAVVTADVKGKGGVTIHAGDRLHGRIMTIEDYQQPYWQVGGVEASVESRWNLAIIFETIERSTGGQAVEQPVSLSPLDDGDRTPHDAPLTPVALEQLRPAGGGYFRFYRKNFLLDQKFESEWMTR